MIVFQQSAFEEGGLFGQSSEDMFLMFFLFDEIFNLLIFLIKVASFSGLDLVVFSEDFVFGKEEICVELRLFDEALYGFFGGGIREGFKGFELL